MLEKRQCDSSYSQSYAGIRRFCFQLSPPAIVLCPAVPRIPPTYGSPKAFAKPVFFPLVLSSATVFRHPLPRDGQTSWATHPVTPTGTPDSRAPKDTVNTG